MSSRALFLQSRRSSRARTFIEFGRRIPPTTSPRPAATLAATAARASPGAASGSAPGAGQRRHPDRQSRHVQRYRELHQFAPIRDRQWNGERLHDDRGRAEPGAVRIKNTGTLDYYDHFLFLESTKYVKVDGFIFDHSNSRYPPYTASITGTFNKAARNIVRRSGPTNGTAAGGMSAEPTICWRTVRVGSARYGFSVGGPSDFSQRIIIRRCVGRVDYSISSEPKATFNVYGNDTGASTFATCCCRTWLQSTAGRVPTGDVTYGAYYFPKNPVNVTIQGSIALNVEAGIRRLLHQGVHGAEHQDDRFDRLGQLRSFRAWRGCDQLDLGQVRRLRSTTT